MRKNRTVCIVTIFIILEFFFNPSYNALASQDKRRADGLSTATENQITLTDGIIINNFNERPINWEGFDGQVGINISFDMKIPYTDEIIIQPPVLIMNPLPPEDNRDISSTTIVI